MASAPDLTQIDAWLDAGLALRVEPWIDALRASAEVPAQLTAARALRHLGDDRGGDALMLRTARRHPGHAPAQTALLRTVLANRGAYAYWRASQRLPMPDASVPAWRAERLCLQGMWLGDLRDETAALALQSEALALDSGDPWLWVEHSHTLARLDRSEAALEAGWQALRVRPGYRTAVQQVAQLLWQLQRRDEACALLEPVLAETGSASIAWQLYGMAADEQQHARSLALLDAVERGFTRAGQRWASQIAARRADALLHLGRLPEAREQAERVLPGGGFYARMAQTLAQPDAVPQRVLLPVSMVKQHWMTCAPATLTALANFWGRKADHLEVAEAICYDGTPAASERIWAVQQGFVVREFKLDWATTCALLDAGLPFALATQYVGSGHLQAVVGYDRLRRTVLIRDPSLPLHVEYDAEQLFDAQQASGPRAMLMLPPEALPRLAGIPLPEADAWDPAHDLQAALQRHDRGAALQALERLQAIDPEGDTLLRSQRLLAIYDGDEPRILAATEALLTRYPQDGALLLSRLTSLTEVRGQAAAQAHLREMVEKPRPDTLTLCRWSAQLAQDARCMPEAHAVARRAVRLDAGSGRAWSELGDRLWQESMAAAALQPLRWASTLQPTQEWAASAYARCCRVAGDAEQGLAWLRERVRVWGARASGPAITLGEELEQVQRGHEADLVLDAALLQRPDDTSLRLHLAERRLRAHRLDEGAALLDGCVNAHAPALLRMRALLLEARGQFDAALAAVREAVSLEPLHLPHHRLLLRLLRRQLGDAAALAQWRQLTDVHPAHVALQRLVYDALPDQAEAINQQLALMDAHHPGLSWLQRERAVQASRQGRLDEAVSLAEAALALAPDLAVSHNVLAYCQDRRGGYAAALPHLHEALRRDAEFDVAMARLLAAPTPQQARAAADFLAAELRRQALLGDGLLTFQREAVSGWSADEILALMQELSAQWPGLWQGPVAVARQLQRVQRTGEALVLLAAACERFPQLPRVHLEHALALQQAHQPESAKAACAAALALSPGWNDAVRVQVDLLGDHGRDWSEARRVLERALDDRGGWDDADLMGLLGWVHEQARQDDEAWVQARRSLLLSPRASWVWALARRISERREDLSAFDALIDEVVRSRPGDADAWAVQATHGRDDEQALEAATRALALQPRQETVWQARFERLQRLGRLDEIEHALAQLPWPAPAPVSLRVWAARVKWARGQHAEALTLIRALREEAPQDEDLCQREADWLDEQDDHPGYLRLAQELMAIAPLEARSHGYLGHALVKNGRGEEALEPLQQALRLSPGYSFAARQLVQAARQANRPELAEPALQMLWPHHPTVQTACDGTEMAARAGQQAQAQAWLERLFTLDAFETDRCSVALAAWHEAGWGEALRVQQRAHVAQGGGPAGVVMDWLVRQERRSFWLAFIQAWRWQVHAQGPHLLRALLRWLKDTDSRFCLPAVIRRFEAALCADDEAWGEASYVLVSMNAHRAVARLLHDWRQRERPPLYAVANLAGALAVLGQWSELEALVAATLQRAPYDEDVRLWELVLLARQPDAAALGTALNRCHEWKPDAWMKRPLDALRALHALAKGTGSMADLRHATRVAGTAQAAAVNRELRRLALARHARGPARWLGRLSSYLG